MRMTSGSVTASGDGLLAAKDSVPIYPNRDSLADAHSCRRVLVGESSNLLRATGHALRASGQASSLCSFMITKVGECNCRGVSRRRVDSATQLGYDRRKDPALAARGLPAEKPGPGRTRERQCRYC
jgi:hypothetical protein